MKETPTLIDAAIRASLKSDGVFPSLRPALLNARKFYLDESMSAYLSEISHRSFQDRPVTDMAILDNVRHQARLPFKTVWIEYDGIAYKKYTKEHWPNTYLQTGTLTEGDDAIPRIGWLLQQHPTLETAFKASTICLVHDKTFMLPYTLTWRTEDGPPPWPTFDLPVKNSHSELATGVAGYNSESVRYIYEYPKTTHSDAAIKTSIVEFVGEIRRIWCLLATLNDVPIISTVVTPAKGYFARGQYRKFVEHTVLTLKVPAKRSIAWVAKRALTNMKRRAHPVRGHWRLYHRGEAVLCAPSAHVWAAGVEGSNQIKCTNCPAWKTWIPDHQRGDASQAIVTHDYSVQKAS